MKLVWEIQPDESAVGICAYRDQIFILTDRRLYRVDDADDEVKMTVRIISQDYPKLFE